MNRLHVLGLPRSKFFVHQQMREADNAVHRCPQLVRHVCKKRTLGTTREHGISGQLTGLSSIVSQLLIQSCEFISRELKFLLRLLAMRDVVGAHDDAWFTPKRNRLHAERDPSRLALAREQ